MLPLERKQRHNQGTSHQPVRIACEMPQTKRGLENARTAGFPKRKRLKQDHGGKQRPSQSSTTMLCHDDYTIGWICALPLEIAAARGM